MAGDSRDETGPQTAPTPGGCRPVPRSPLMIGGIAYACLFWMVFVVLMQIAWRLFGG